MCHSEIPAGATGKLLLARAFASRVRGQTGCCCIARAPAGRPNRARQEAAATGCYLLRPRSDQAFVTLCD